VYFLFTGRHIGFAVDKSYYGSLSGSHSRCFRIRHEKSRELPPGGEITMTSYLACNKTSVSRKPCIADKSTMDHYEENMVALSESVVKKCVQCSLAEAWRWCHVRPVGDKTSLSLKPCMVAEKLLWITVMNSWSLSNFKRKRANINSNNWSVYQLCYWRESLVLNSRYFFHLTQLHSLLTGMYLLLYETPLQGNSPEGDNTLENSKFAGSLLQSHTNNF